MNVSCRAALNARLSIVEVPMTYEERVGRSKLRVIRDGLRDAGGPRDVVSQITPPSARPCYIAGARTWRARNFDTLAKQGGQGAERQTLSGDFEKGQLPVGFVWAIIR
jgi:hypothetical protein